MLKERLWTGLVGGGGILFCVIVGGWYYGLLLFLLAGVAFDEWIRLRHPQRFTPFYCLAVVLFLLFSSILIFSLFEHFIYWSLFVLLLLSFTVFSRNQMNVEDVSHMFLGLIYIGLGFYAMWQFRLVPAGMYFTLYILLATWANDSAAYFVGKSCGRHKLWPAISPNKTVEGALGGVAAALFVSFLFVWLLPVSWWKLLGAGLLLALSGQLGDLIESAIKRSFHVKDSSRVLPGHGGILDRFDSLLIVFPMAFLLFISQG